MVEPWDDGDDPIETKRLNHDRPLPIVVPSNGEPWWGIHAGHHARQPQASPFVKINWRTLERTDLFTVELTQTPGRPKLVRAYPGDYIPPLPWMNSARDADGGIRACLEYWRGHAYVYRPGLMIRRAERPDWF
jgi:hypothetical protein